MSKFIVGTFLILGWTFYVLSGGADFVPEGRSVAKADQTIEETQGVIEDAVAVVEVEPTAIEATAPVTDVHVTRAETSALLNLSTAELTQPVADVVETSATVVVEEDAAVETVLASIIEEVIEETPTLDLRVVAGSRVNMRSGPGTNYAVLDTLNGGTEAEVLEVDASGWARIRLQDTGTIGWMAERLLSES